MPKKSKIRSSDKKLEELILLISSKCEDDPKFGSVKLNKLLFHCDFSSYLTFGEPITGQEYFALKQGPAPRRMLPVTKKMQAAGRFGYKEVDYYGRSQKKPIALSYPDVAIFTAQQVNLVDLIIKKNWDKTAKEISDASHLFVGWKVASEKETIPYSTALFGFRPPTEEEVAYGLELEPLAIESLRRVRT